MLNRIKSPLQVADVVRECGEALGREKSRFVICAGTGCVAGGSMDVFREFERLLKAKGLYGDVQLLFEGHTSPVGVIFSGCYGFCQVGPLVQFQPKGIIYTKVTVQDVDEIIKTTFEEDSVVERLLYRKHDGTLCPTEDEVPFYGKQKRVILAECGHINPEDIREYFATGGYQALASALSKMDPDGVIDIISRSGLRGRGGAGFPAGRKMALARESQGGRKYVICNGDEGDPGAFMDRSVLEANPHSVLEGMAIAAYAIGADKGYIYVRAEYPLAVTRIDIAIDQARRSGVLGKGIMGTDFDFDVEVFQGAGAFICGEATALIRSIEGFRGSPEMTLSYYPTERGLWGKPTLLNNVKTLAFIPKIIANGVRWFTGMGTKGSPGTAVFALTGEVRNNGLIEVPMGITLREIIFDIGEGVPGGREFKAVQIGGPSGGCLPRELLDIEVDFDSLLDAGAMMGSGGMVVVDDTTCMVDLARYFLAFTRMESCGKCVPCRIGTKRMLEMLTRICEGKGEPEDVGRLEELALDIKEGSLCALGGTAPNPVLTTLRYFKDEYEAHIHEKRCPAGLCANLVTFHIDSEKCNGCTVCARNCPADAITGEKKKPHVIDQDKCTKCRECLSRCRFDAVYTE
ncbi:MAG: NADH-quinone oxidoreductase subunit NuoF [Actinobacteria bacterium]|nr:NADH-quinone oxidoreductase subunit NuoF [Actinomycetota bacterium]